ncbi:hypothetical protein BDA99DRAFT_528908 [Phascolomyces articulosus]|uniref:TM7S3/TM198-like domain-containing protein n=1 Tax=Phascolomyces articulosus TaxID=60185 RepID=A0AAD5P793_9FUNG|nr:hypothetical protein BDA99DRAFT_528908 [Phascolomyces articulosus]
MPTNKRFLFIIMMIVYPILVIAAPADLPRTEPGVLYLPDNAIVMDDGYELSIQGVLGGIIIILCALLLWFRAFLGLRLAQGLVGFIIIAFIAWVLLSNFEPENTYGTNRWTLYLTVPVACGLVGGLLLMCALPMLYLISLGGLGGLAAGLWVLGWRTDLSIQSNWGRAILLVILVVVGCVFAALDVFFHMVGAALTGAYILFLGLDIYFHTGFTYCFIATLDANPHHDYSYQTTRETHIIQSILIVAMLMGLMIQVCFGWRGIETQHDLYFLPEKRILPPTLRFSHYYNPNRPWGFSWRPAVAPPPPPV